MLDLKGARMQTIELANLSETLRVAAMRLI